MPASNNSIPDFPSKSTRLTALAQQLRREVIQMIAVAGSGHLASPLGLADFMAFLYSYILRHNPADPTDPARDRFFLSAGHVCPILYATLAEFDYFPPGELFTLRELDTRLQGHPERQPEIGLENTSGPLGQGVSMAVGNALDLKRSAWAANAPIPQVYCLSSDGEQQEGQVWEAYQLAAQNSLYNFTLIIDVNDIQISGRTSQTMNQRDLALKLRDFGFATYKVDGHNFLELAQTFQKSRRNICAALQTGDPMDGQPQAIIMDTTPGKGVSFMENDYRWHSHSLSLDQVTQALTELGVTDFNDPQQLLPEFIAWYKAKLKEKSEKTTSPAPIAQPPLKATRDGFGTAITQLASHHPELTVLCADLTESLRLTDFAQQFPEQFVEVGVAEQNMASAAAGIAMNSKTVFATSFAAFNPGRNWEQIRVSVALQNLNVKIVGSHAGLATGPDGATHQALEDIALTRVLPNFTVIVPADYLEAQAATQALIETHFGPAYLRLTREPTPILTDNSQLEPFQIGRARLMKSGHHATIIACGAMVAPALEAAAQLELEHQLQVRVINMHTIKPLDTRTLFAAAQETPLIVTVEEHQVAGGLGSACAEFLLQNPPPNTQPLLKMIGLQDTFGESGSAVELWQKYNLTPENIIQTILDNLP